jgi:hypothetical protein
MKLCQGYPNESRSASEWVKAYDHIHQELTAKGFKPKLQTLDNKASAALKGIRDIPGTNTYLFIKLTNILKDRQITYGKIVCDYKPPKKRKRAREINSGRRQAKS